MPKSSVRSAIRLRGVRHNNLKNFDLDLPLNQLIVLTGLSGSGKSSLAFDTLFAEGQRRYIETFSPYARQFFDRMDKPQVDSIEGIPPAIAIEQRNSVKTTRSTVGTMTEICDYVKVLWPRLARLHCRQCGRPVVKESPQAIWSALSGQNQTQELLITFELPLSDKLSTQESLSLVSKQGYQRLLVNGEILRLEQAMAALPEAGARRVANAGSGRGSLTVVQDRLPCCPQTRARFIEACEQAYHFGKGKLSVWKLAKAGSVSDRKEFSNLLHCAGCDLEYREPSTALFSFNHPVGACPKCRGFGRVISIDYGLAIPDRSKTLAQGVVKPWQTGTGLECHTDLLRMCRHYEIPTDVPFEELPEKWQKLVVDGDPDYGSDEEHEWPRAWYGVKGYFRWLESKAYKMHVRVLLSRYRAYTPCPDCAGTRFQPEALLYRLNISGTKPGKSKGDKGAPLQQGPAEITLPEFYRMPIRDSVKVMQSLNAERNATGSRNDGISLALKEVLGRLTYLDDVGLGYLSLDRPMRSLSGGETERVNLTTCLGTRLVNTLFVLDEPSVGLHPRDTSRLVRILCQLRNAGNTVLVVEHEASVMRAADHIVDLGPGHGATGGQVVFQGSYPELLKCEQSLTGLYLSGRNRVQEPNASNSRATQGEAPVSALAEAKVPFRTALAAGTHLKISRATRHNLNNLELKIPLLKFVCVTGVSGSGKTTLVREIVLPILQEKLKTGNQILKASDRLGEGNETQEDEESEHGKAVITGYESLQRVVLVDQSVLGKTPRSNPAVYTGAFDEIRELFAQSEPAKRRGLNASAFSFNSGQGQCQRCRGAGFEKIEMQFLSDVFIRCPDCDGRRYRDHILELKISAPGQAGVEWSIGDVLEATVEETIAFLAGFPESRPAQRALVGLRLLEEVGLGYLKLGQPINTLSGGESQRLKLVRHLAEATASDAGLAPQTNRARVQTPVPEQREPRGTLFLFDEPTTGLHFDDVRQLLKVFQRLVKAGQSVLVIEHNLDVIQAADWIIDMGPDAGDQGGCVVAEGEPEALIEADTCTGRALREYHLQTADGRTRSVRG